MEQRIPAEVFSPGEYIKDEMEARGWTQEDLATILNRPVATINKILNAKTSITVDTAMGLAAAFGTSADVWLNLETAYSLWKANKGRAKSKKHEAGDIALRANLYAIAPVKEMVKRRWIIDPRDANDLERKMSAFFEAEDLSRIPQLSMAARKSDSYEAGDNPAQRAWGFRVKALAKAVTAAKFDDAVFHRELPKLRRFLAHEASVREVPRALSDLGVRFVLVEHLKKSYLDGGALWLDEQSPVVALTTRYNRIDNFWFVLFHELMHIKHRDNESIDEKLCGKDAKKHEEKPEAEKRADREAGEMLIPSEEMDDFFRRHNPLFTMSKISQFANRIKVHPGVIVGQIHNRTKDHAIGRQALTPVRDLLLETALADGWDYAPQLH